MIFRRTPRSWELWAIDRSWKPSRRWRDDFNFPLVVDPVMISKHGTPANDGGSQRRPCFESIVPVAYLLTPNLHEAAALTGLEVDDAG